MLAVDGKMAMAHAGCREQQPSPTIHIEEQPINSPSSSSHVVDERDTQLHSPSSNGPRDPSQTASTASSASTEHDVASYFEERYPDRQISSELVPSHASSPNSSPDESSSGSPKMFGGILSSINTLYSLPIKQTSRNAELLHFCKLSDEMFLR